MCVSEAPYAGGGMKSEYYRWPKAIIPYQISSSFGGGRDKFIYSAMKVSSPHHHFYLRKLWNWDLGQGLLAGTAHALACSALLARSLASELVVELLCDISKVF